MFCPISSGTSFVLQCPGEARGRSEKEAHQHTQKTKKQHITQTQQHAFLIFFTCGQPGERTYSAQIVRILFWVGNVGWRERECREIRSSSPQTGPAWCLQQFPFSGATDLPGVPCLDVITSPGAWYPGAFTEDDGQRQ